MTAGSVFSNGFRTDPYWWDTAPPEDASADPLPADADIVVIGSGYCGLIAAVELARTGLRAAVLDAGPLGFGASTRSGGMVSFGQKLILSGTYKVFGEGNAGRVFAESKASFEFTTAFIEREGLDADYRQTGRFFAAYTPKDFAALA
jgi:gamma-glutamylputrescine oxidase